MAILKKSLRSPQFPDWVDTPSKTALTNWLQDTLQLEFQARPSTEELVSRLGELAPLLHFTLAPSQDTVDTWIKRPAWLLIRDENVLGTDVPAPRSPVWSYDFATLGDFVQHRAMLTRYKRLVLTRKRALGKQHPYTLWSMLRYAWMSYYFSTGAMSLFEDLLAQEGLPGLGFPAMLSSRLGAAWLHAQVGDPKSAEPMETLVAEFRQHFGSEHEETVKCMLALASCWVYTGKPREGERLLQELVPVHKRIFGDKSPQARDCLFVMALTTKELGHYPAAVKLFETLLQESIWNEGVQHYRVCRCLEELEGLHALLRHFDKAIDTTDYLIKWLGRTFGEGYIRTKEARRRRIGYCKAIGRTDKASGLKELGLGEK